MYVYVRDTCVVRLNGEAVYLQRGDIWDDRDPTVRARPEFFTSDPPRITTTPGWSPPAEVEQATAAPGERRSTRRAG